MVRGEFMALTGGKPRRRLSPKVILLDERGRPLPPQLKLVIRKGRRRAS